METCSLIFSARASLRRERRPPRPRAVTAASRSPSGCVSAAVNAAVTSAGLEGHAGLGRDHLRLAVDQGDGGVLAGRRRRRRRPAAPGRAGSPGPRAAGARRSRGRSDSAATKSRGWRRTLLSPKTRVTGAETAGLAMSFTAARTSASSMSGWAATTRSTTAVGSSARYAAMIASRAWAGSIDRPALAWSTRTRVPWKRTRPSRAGVPTLCGEARSGSRSWSSPRPSPAGRARRRRCSSSTASTGSQLRPAPASRTDPM